VPVMLVYGGIGDDISLANTSLPYGQVSGGMQYDPSNDTWTGLTQSGQPSSRFSHQAVMMGNNMVVWGGQSDSAFVGTGARYDTQTLGWMVTNAPEPDARDNFTAVVLTTPNVLIIFGGEGTTSPWLATGGRYDPATNSWTPIATALSPRESHTAVSTGTSMIVWGGDSNGNLVNTGGVYKPKS